MPHRLPLALLALLPCVAFAQPGPQPVATTPFVATGGSAARTPAGRAGDTFNVRDYGAVGDGASHPAGTALGITTLAGLAGYTSNGKTPYSFVSAYPFGHLFNLYPGAAQTTGATVLNFATTATIGIQVSENTAAALGASALVLFDLTLTSDASTIGVGTALTATCLAGGTTVASLGTQSNGAHNVNLSTPTTAICATSALIAAAVAPASGKWSIPVIYTTGIRQGDLVTGSSCIPAGTQVTQVERGRMEVWLSAALTCQPTAGATLTFIPSWLSNVTNGMTVTGPSGIFTGGATVSSVSTAAGTVTLSAATTGATASEDALVGVGGPNLLGTPVTFWAAYTDAEAVSLEMDRLGIQAAIKAAEAAGGGTARLSPGVYLLDGTVIDTAASSVGRAQQTVSLEGDIDNINGVWLRATKDFGPGNAALSCDDPTGKWQNQRGIYNTSGGTLGGQFCPGWWGNFHLTMNGFAWGGYGKPSTLSGVPVAMDGIKQGPRRNLRNIVVDGFNFGGLFAGDHTEMRNAQFSNNWVGWRHDHITGGSPQSSVGLFGDEVWDRFYSQGNSYAGIVVDPGAYLNGPMTHPYLGFNPLAIRCEPGTTVTTCLQGVVMESPNFESTGCGIITDAGIQQGRMGLGGSRTLADIHIMTPFFGPTLTNVPAAGCTWAAYIDMYTIQGLVIEDIFSNTFGAVANSTSLIRVARTDNFGAGWNTSQGGITLKSAWWPVILQSLSTFATQVVGGAGGNSSTFWFTAGWQNVSLESPSMRIRLFPICDAASFGSGIAIGVPLEYSTSVIDSLPCLQAAGISNGSQAIAGIGVQSWPNNPQTFQLLTAVAVAGSHIPVVTNATQAIGTLLKAGLASGSTQGKAVLATGPTDGQTIGVVQAVGTSALTYVRMMTPGGF